MELESYVRDLQRQLVVRERVDCRPPTDIDTTSEVHAGSGRTLTPGHVSSRVGERT